MTGEASPLFTVRDLRLTRASGPGYTLSIPRLDIAAGDKLAITGPSGCGKSTALDILGLVLRPDAAERFLFTPPGRDSQDLAALWRDDRRDHLAGLRLRHLGYVLQTGGLLPFLSVGENMELSARAKGLPGSRRRVADIARELGIERLLGSRPDRLSIGERQRVAIGRALACEPEVILADEPTASLDPEHAATVMGLLLDAVAAHAVTLLLVTHSADTIRGAGLREHRMTVAAQPDGAVLAVLEA